jgi:hypothetical protein
LALATSLCELTPLACSGDMLAPEKFLATLALALPALSPNSSSRSSGLGPPPKNPFRRPRTWNQFSNFKILTFYRKLITRIVLDKIAIFCQIAENTNSNNNIDPLNCSEGFGNSDKIFVINLQSPL